MYWQQPSASPLNRHISIEETTSDGYLRYNRWQHTAASSTSDVLRQIHILLAYLFKVDNNILVTTDNSMQTEDNCQTVNEPAEAGRSSYTEETHQGWPLADATEVTVLNLAHSNIRRYVTCQLFTQGSYKQTPRFTTCWNTARLNPLTPTAAIWVQL